MTGNQPEDPEDHALLTFLAAQRGAVLSIVAGGRGGVAAAGRAVGQAPL